MISDRGEKMEAREDVDFSELLAPGDRLSSDPQMIKLLDRSAAILPRELGRRHRHTPATETTTRVVNLLKKKDLKEEQAQALVEARMLPLPFFTYASPSFMTETSEYTKVDITDDLLDRIAYKIRQQESNPPKEPEEHSIAKLKAEAVRYLVAFRA